VISKHIITDEQKPSKGTIWPKQKLYKIILSKDAKADILRNIDSWDLSWNIMHQHIYKGDIFYLTSYDNLDKGSTWISMELAKTELDKLKEQKVINTRLTDLHDILGNRYDALATAREVLGIIGQEDAKAGAALTVDTFTRRMLGVGKELLGGSTMLDLDSEMANLKTLYKDEIAILFSSNSVVPSRS